MTRPFKILGVQQIAIGHPRRPRCAGCGSTCSACQSVGTYRSERENVDEDILSIAGVEIDLMEPVDAAKSPKVHEPRLEPHRALGRRPAGRGRVADVTRRPLHARRHSQGRRRPRRLLHPSQGHRRGAAKRRGRVDRARPGTAADRLQKLTQRGRCSHARPSRSAVTIFDMRSWLLALVIVGCGGDNSTPPDAPPTPDAGPIGARTHTLYLNFEGITLAAGSADDATQNLSSLATGPTTLSSYLGSAVDRSTQITALVDEISNILAPYDVDVVMTRPATGTYIMVVSTDSASTTLACTNCPALAPADCGAIDSPVAFNFGAGSGSALPVHGLTSDTIAMVGLSVLGVPTSAVPDDCMCFTDSNCVFPPTQQCTIGGAGTAISATRPGCPPAGSATVMNETALFLAGFGPS